MTKKTDIEKHVNQCEDGSWVCTIIDGFSTYMAHGATRQKAVQNCKRKMKRGEEMIRTCPGYE